MFGNILQCLLFIYKHDDAKYPPSLRAALSPDKPRTRNSTGSFSSHCNSQLDHTIFHIHLATDTVEVVEIFSNLILRSIRQSRSSNRANDKASDHYVNAQGCGLPLQRIGEYLQLG